MKSENMRQELRGFIAPINGDASKPKLLVVDDDQSVRESLRKLLEAEGYEVHSAHDGVEAVDYVRSNPPHLMVLDLNLDKDDAWKVSRTMMEMNPSAPIVVITAEFDQRNRAFAAGVEALFEKPIDVPVFLKIISDLLAGIGQRRLDRVGGNHQYCRATGHNEVFVKMLNERASTPLQLSSALNAASQPTFERLTTDHDGDLI